MQGYLGNDQGIIAVFDDITEEKCLKGTLGRCMSRDIVERRLDYPDRQLFDGKCCKATIIF
jgi:hypothetical protein